MSRPVNLSLYRLNEDQKEIVMKNMGLVRKVINDRFRVYKEYYDDMLQEGAIGLIKAVSRHDSSKGAQLSTFAYLCIKNEIQKFVSERTDTIKVPVSVGLAIDGVRRAEERGEGETAKADILEHNQISEEMLNAGRLALQTVSMDEENDDGLRYGDTIAGPELDISEPSQEEKRMYSRLHNWLIFQYPNELTEIRIYVNYIARTFDRTTGMSQVIESILCDYQTNRGTLKRITTKYDEITKEFLKSSKF